LFAAKTWVEKNSAKAAADVARRNSHIESLIYASKQRNNQRIVPVELLSLAILWVQSGWAKPVWQPMGEIERNLTQRRRMLSHPSQALVSGETMKRRIFIGSSLAK